MKCRYVSIRMYENDRFDTRDLKTKCHLHICQRLLLTSGCRNVAWLKICFSTGVFVWESFVERAFLIRGMGSTRKTKSVEVTI